MDKTVWINKQGETVHPDMVRVDDKIKDELVRGILSKVLNKREELRIFKSDVAEEISAYMDLLRDEYGIDAMKCSSKGNITLQSFDGLLKVQIAVQTHIDFDEKLTLAKEKIDEYLNELTKDAGDEVKTLVLKGFEVDKKGNVNAKLILSLKRYDIAHPKWLEAMKLIDNAVEIVGSKSYMRFYTKKDQSSKWENISLNFSDIGE